MNKEKKYNDAVKFVYEHGIVLRRVEKKIGVCIGYLSRNSGKNLLAEMYDFASIAERVGMPKLYAIKIASQLEESRVKKCMQFYCIYLDAKMKSIEQIEEVYERLS